MKAKKPRKESHHRLRVFFDESSGEVRIEGNKVGLEYLAAVCLSVIGQPAGPNHWHLGEAFNTLEPGSPDLIISYRDQPQAANPDGLQKQGDRP